MPYLSGRVVKSKESKDFNKIKPSYNNNLEGNIFNANLLFLCFRQSCHRRTKTKRINGLTAGSWNVFPGHQGPQRYLEMGCFFNSVPCCGHSRLLNIQCHINSLHLCSSLHREAEVEICLGS